MKKLYTLSLLVLALGLGSCSDDPVAPVDPYQGRSAQVSVFYSHSGVTAPLKAKVSNVVIIDSLTYETRASGSVAAGEARVVSFTDISDAPVVSTNAVIVDTGRSVWGIYSGSGTGDEAFAISTKLHRGLNASVAGVQLINASKTSGDARLVLDVVGGTEVTANPVGYKTSSGEFKPVNVATSSMFVVGPDNTTVLASLNLSGNLALQPGKNYTVILHGSGTTGARPLKASIYQEVE